MLCRLRNDVKGKTPQRSGGGGGAPSSIKNQTFSRLNQKTTAPLRIQIFPKRITLFYILRQRLKLTLVIHITGCYIAADPSGSSAGRQVGSFFCRDLSTYCRHRSSAKLYLSSGFATSCSSCMLHHSKISSIFFLTNRFQS